MSDLLDREKFFEVVITKYLQISSKFSQNYIDNGFSNFIHIDDSQLIGAINDSYIDYLFLKERRRKFKIISEGKIAGILAFRLSRIRPFSSTSITINKNKHFIDLHYTMAIFIALYYINKKWSNIDSSIRHEIFFSMKARHVNQETLGLVFDSILHHNISEISRL